MERSGVVLVAAHSAELGFGWARLVWNHGFDRLALEGGAQGWAVI